MNINEYSHLQQEIPVTVLSEEARSKDQPLLPYQRFFLDYQLYSPNKDIMNITMFRCSGPEGCSGPGIPSLRSLLNRIHFQ